MRSQRGAVGQLDDDEEIALILDRQEGRGNAQRDQIGRARAPRRTAPSIGPAQRISPRTPSRIGMRQPVEAGIEPAERRRTSLAGRWRRNAALSAGLSVSELKAEMPTEIATVSAN